jgi:hypothetical protein
MCRVHRGFEVYGVGFPAFSWRYRLSIVSNIDDDYTYPMVERTGLGKLLDIVGR